MTVTIREAVGGKPVYVEQSVASVGPMSSPATGRQVGFSAPNKPEDVLKIQGLLNLLGATPRKLKENGTCDGELVEAIKSMQKIVGLKRPDGQIDPARGTNTIVKLNALVKPLTLARVEDRSAALGGYVVKYTERTPPAPYRVLLTVAPAATLTIKAGQRVAQATLTNFMEVTKLSGSHLIDKSNMHALLKIMEARGLWGATGHFALVVLRDDAIVSISATKALDCPIKPWSGGLTPAALGAGDDGPGLQYVGEGNSGSLFIPGKINGKRFWKRATKLITKKEDRGFDCITYTGSLYEIEAGAAYGTSAAMAGELDAEAVEWSNTDGDKIENGIAKGEIIKKYFDVAAHTGTHLLWHGSHIVMVVNKQVHEFSQSKGGYATKAAKDWMSDAQQYHLYSLPTSKQF